jgi:hypothetical protein
MVMSEDPRWKVWSVQDDNGRHLVVPIDDLLEGWEVALQVLDVLRTAHQGRAFVVEYNHYMSLVERAQELENQDTVQIPAPPNFDREIV